MNKNNLFLLVLVSISLSITSCREKSDTLLPYDKYDVYNYGYATFSYEEQFKAFWTAMNCNYTLWDYEEEFGVDWDSTFDEYLPKFKELDAKGVVSDNELFSLYEEMVKPLHDGHLAIQICNIKSGKYSAYIKPSEIRNQIERKSDMDVPETNLYYYYSPAAGDNMVVDHDEMKYDYLFPASHNCQYALFKENIVYYQLSAFNLSDFDKKAGLLEKQERLDSVVNVRNKWFDKVRELHQNRSLKGVIIDVRNNGGGYAEDYKYVLGSLQDPNYTINGRNYLKIGEERYKTGVGRLDFSSQRFPCLFTLNSERETISDVPVVILANCNTVSTAEFVCLNAKNMDNGYVIGRRTWGAYSTLNNAYTESYSGIIGEQNKGPFFMYIPKCAFFSDDGEIIEGKGVTPDIDVQLDVQEYYSTGRDTQLERALEFIRTGK